MMVGYDDDYHDDLREVCMYVCMYIYMYICCLVTTEVYLTFIYDYRGVYLPTCCDLLEL